MNARLLMCWPHLESRPHRIKQSQPRDWQQQQSRELEWWGMQKVGTGVFPWEQLQSAHPSSRAGPVLGFGPFLGFETGVWSALLPRSLEQS